MFKRGKFNLSKKQYKDINPSIGNKFFNTPDNINKWRFWSILSKNNSMGNYLPHTNKLKGFESLDNMLNLYNSVYLKPYDLSRGRGIIIVHKSKDGCHFIDRFKTETILKNNIDVEDYLYSLTTSNKYIIHQSVPFKFENKNVDLRVYLQKNKTKQWNCSGIATRVS